MGILSGFLNKRDDKKLDKFIIEKIKDLVSPDLKVWDKDDYFNFCREDGIRNLTRIRGVTSEQAGNIYDKRFKEVCNKHSLDIEKIFKDKMEIQKALYPAEFILLGNIDDE